MDSSFPAFRQWILSLGRNYAERARVLSELTGTQVRARTVIDLASGRLPRQLRAILHVNALHALLTDLDPDRKSINHS